MENNELQPIEQAQELEVVQISTTDALMALNKAEVDVQIATAKAYPRNLSNVLRDIETLATLDEETAQSCFYILRRQGKIIEGASIRMAEIIASSWGNIRVQSRIIGNDGKMITAQGVCMDLEKNVAFSSEVKRRITDKYGKPYNDDMQVVTGNAACAIAMRNAVLKVVPSALIKKVMTKVKQVSLGESLTLEQQRSNMLAYYQKLGVDADKVFEYLSVSKVDEINSDMLIELRGLANAIKDGQTTIQETFFPKPDVVVNEEDGKPSDDLFGDNGKTKKETKK